VLGSLIERGRKSQDFIRGHVGNDIGRDDMCPTVRQRARLVDHQ